LQDWLRRRAWPPDWASTLGVGGVVVAITYVSLIVGELVPKQLALRNPEGGGDPDGPGDEACCRVIAAPIVWLLDRSGRSLLWLLGQRGESDNRVTEEEVHVLLAEAHEGGVLEAEEREMITGVMRLSDRTARALMTPRHEVEMLPLDATSVEAVAAIRKVARPRMPVADAEGEVVGIVLLADAFQAVSRREALDLKALVHEVPVVSDRPRRWTSSKSCRNPNTTWRWSMTNTAISKASSPPATCWPRSPARLRQADDRRTAHGRTRGRQPCWWQAGCRSTNSATGWVCRARWRDPDHIPDTVTGEGLVDLHRQLVGRGLIAGR
jgi:CBS domain-containing protein